MLKNVSNKTSNNEFGNITTSDIKKNTILHIPSILHSTLKRSYDIHSPALWHQTYKVHRKA